MKDKTHVPFCPVLHKQLVSTIEGWRAANDDNDLVAFNTVLTVLMGWVKNLDQRLKEAEAEECPEIADSEFMKMIEEAAQDDQAK